MFELKTTIYRQNVARFFKLGPSTSFFFVNFDFSYFFVFFLKRAISTSTQRGKSMILKMTREKSNAFENLLKN